MMTTSATPLTCAGASHTGLVRDNNEDLFYCDPDAGLLMVIDGMGGHAAGEKAAEIALLKVCAALEQSEGSTEERLRKAIDAADEEIFRQAASRPEWNGMGCVLTAAVVEGERVTVGHVGDTRLYLLSGGRIEKVTRDHSPVGALEDACLLSEGEAMRHPHRHEICRGLGMEPHQPDDPDFIDIIRLPFAPGDSLILCTDGLSDLVPTSEMSGIVGSRPGDPAETVSRLIDAALDAGGTDNVTVIFATRRKDCEPVEDSTGRGDAREGSSEAAVFAMRSFPEAGGGGECSPPRERNWPRSASFVIGLLLGGALCVFSCLLWRPAEQASPAKLVEQPRRLSVDPRAAGAFHSISDALAQAAPGDTVEVAPGEYIERVTLREGVALVSKELRGALLRAPGVDEAGEMVAVNAVGVRGSRFHGFRVEGDDQHPLDVGLRINNAEVDVTDIAVVGARAAGIEVAGPASTASIRSCLIHENAGVGILVRAPSSPRLLHNLIRGNGRRANHPGVTIVGPAAPVLLGNMLVANGATGIAGLPPDRQVGICRENLIAGCPTEVSSEARPAARKRAHSLRR